MDCETKKMSVGSLWQDSKSIDQNPRYQREGGVWSKERQQLFIDSLIVGYDIPKVYMNDLSGNEATNHQLAIIDGKQRLTTVWAFMDNELALGKEFMMNPDEVEKHPDYGIPPQALQTWDEIPVKWQQFIRDKTLDVVVVRHASDEDIEELFERLNNGEPLTAAEARNNILGDMTDLVKEVSENKFFTETLKIKNTRYRHRELSAKFLLFENTYKSSGNLYSDLKKRHLDDLCDQNRTLSPGDKQLLLQRVEKTLAVLRKVFSDNDPLLSKMATPPLYYVWVKDITDRYGHEKLHSLIATFLKEFEIARTKNLDLPEDKQDVGLLDFSRRSQQATNDKENLRWRCNYLTKEFLKATPEVTLKDKRRAFTDEERYVIWELGQRHCKECDKDLPELDDMQADHVVQWAMGGPTSLKNARCLCEDCNQALKKQIG